MNMRILVLIVFGVVLSALGTSSAWAWPDMPPDKAVLSGPGIKGQVEITEPEVLEVLRLGGLEDMTWGAIEKPEVSGEGFKIIRYFEGGEFRMGDLTYYPRATGARSVVYFDDGGVLTGDRSTFHGKWLYTTANGDAVMLNYLKRLNLPVAKNQDATNNAGRMSATHDILPVEIRTGVPVTLGFTIKNDHKIARVILVREGDPERIVLAATASGKPGHYLLTHLFSKAGTWNWSVGSFQDALDVPMPPIQVVANTKDPIVQVMPQAAPANEQNSTAEGKALTGGETKKAPQTTDAPAQSGVDMTTLAIAIVAAGVGILGIGAVLMRGETQRP